jgi:hypothetical protein
MMRSWRWRAAAVLAPAGMMAAMLTGASAASAASAATSPTWQLVNQFAGTTVCDTPGNSDFLEVHLSGTWSTPITIGASNLPAGASYSFSGYRHVGYRLEGASSPIPPGSSNGDGLEILGSPNMTMVLYVDVRLPASIAVGTSVTVTLSATDGITTETEPVTILVQNSCTVF